MAVHSTIVGLLGVAILLIAFFLNLFRWLRTGGAAYLSLNLIGATLACWSSYLIQFLPFVLLEGTWAIVAVVALARAVLKQHLGAKTLPKAPPSVVTPTKVRVHAPEVSDCWPQALPTRQSPPRLRVSACQT
jgi:hypothetical protein